jgi:cobalt-zinc-cadmium efflux system outer membrane protein
MNTSHASLALVCLLSALPVGGGETLTLADALERVSAGSSTLAAAAAHAESMRARTARESMAPPFVLGADIENFAGSGTLKGFDSAENTLQVSRLIELGGKRAGRRALGDAEDASAAHALDSARLDSIALTTRRFVEVVADQERLRLAIERADIAARTRAEVERVVRGARNPETDLRAAEIALDDADLDREHHEHELRAARVTLASTWGSRDPDFGQAAMSLDTLPALEPFESLAARLPGSASLVAWRLEADGAAARLRLARAQTRPDLNVGLGVRRLEAFGDHGLVMSLSMPLGSSTRARLAQSESRAAATAVAHRREAAELDAYQQLFEQYQELGHARAEFTTLGASMIPRAEQALALAQRGFDLGRFGFLALTQAQDTLFELRRRRIDAAARFHTLLADLQRLTAAVESP